MKNSARNVQPKVAGRANAVQCRPQPSAQCVTITDNRPTAIQQRKIQEISNASRQKITQFKAATGQSASASMKSKAVVQRVIHKAGLKSKPIGLKASDFYNGLPSDAHRQWAIILHADEQNHYTREKASLEIEDRITKNLPIPAIDAQEDPQMRVLIEKYQAGKSRKQDRQVHGMQGLYENGTQVEKDQMITFLNVPANAKGFTESVRQGELNETLLTKDTKDAALRSLGAVPGIESKGIIDASGAPIGWTTYQSATSYPTRYFTFPNTSPDDDGNQIQDTHINGHTYREDSDGKKHLTVGSTSERYHFSAKNSLEANYKKSTRVLSFARRNVKAHRKSLATRKNILAIGASARAEQMYRTTKGTILHLNDVSGLELYAEHVQIHTDKVNTDLYRQAKRLRADGNESESDISDWENEVDMDADTDDEAEVRIKKRKKKKHKK